MVRRSRTAGHAVAPPPAGQRRLDEVLAEGPEARLEREYRELGESRRSGAHVPYEERLVLWFQERERAEARRFPRPAPSTEGAAASTGAKP